ncbi:DUF4231 domain-containing protein [Nocardia sp. NPDC050718]|uniref:DUF4231 domain-containing protein n=1 Tax=Nocardia sp. NPDC050718 TaxID=3155788 RepID=UPI0033F80FBE
MSGGHADGFVFSTEDYPALYQSADSASLRGQFQFLRAHGARLVLAVVAAVFAAFTIRVGSHGIDAAAIVTTVAFVTMLALNVWQLRDRPDQDWYEGRALAESVKTLTWKYMVGGSPFPSGMPAAAADQLLVDRVRRLQRPLRSLNFPPPTGRTISDRMREVRQLPLGQRRAVYNEARVLEQQHWYATKAEYHYRRANQFGFVSLSFEIVGISAALAKALGAVDFDLAGIVAATIAGLAAWSSARQHTTTAVAYSVAAHELSTIRDMLERDHTEQEWSSAVADAEEAISREHTLWRASHTQ